MTTSCPTSPPDAPPPDAAAGTATARLFIALWPDDAVRAGLLRWQAACTWPGGSRPTLAERLHLTLHFLGPVGSDRIPALAGAIEPASPPFELLLGRAAVWDNGVAVLEPCGGSPAGLSALHARLGAAVQRLGLPAEARPFRPHVTLARHARGAVLPAEGPALRWPVQGHVLVESDRGYRVLRRFG